MRARHPSFTRSGCSSAAAAEPDPSRQGLAEGKAEDVVVGMNAKHVRPAASHRGRDGEPNRSVVSRPKAEPSRTRATVWEAGTAWHFDAIDGDANSGCVVNVDSSQTLLPERDVLVDARGPQRMK